MSNNKNIAANHQILIKDAVNTIFSDAIKEITPLPPGLSGSALYRISLENHEIVARLCDPNNPYTDLNREYHNMQIAAKLGVAPKTYYCNPTSGIALMGYIKNQDINVITKSNLTIEKLAHSIQQIHTGPTFKAAQPIIELCWKIPNLLNKEISRRPLLVDCVNTVKTLAPALSDPNDLRPCHCDTNKDNLLFDGNQLYWIDWTTSSMDNFYFDLAMVVNLFFYDDNDKAKHFLQTYFDSELSTEQQGKISKMRFVVYTFVGIVLLYSSQLRQASIISEKAIAQLPNYVELMQKFDKKEFNIQSGEEQQKLGWVFLQQAKHYIKTLLS